MKIKEFIIIIFLLIPLFFFNNKATDYLFRSQPKWYFLNTNSYKKFMHILGTAFGFRALTSDFYYIAFLQYYGNRDNAKTRFKDLINYLDDATDADPSFEFVYQYGGAILAFNLKKYDEAKKLLQKGLLYNPRFWKLRLYLGAIAFKEKDKKEEYVKFLEEAIKFEDHPAMIERLLGNIYEQIKPADEVAKYWLWVYKNTKDKQTRKHAYDRLMLLIQQRKIQNIEKIIE